VGDRVAVFLDNSVEAVVAIFGTLEAGGCIVVVNTLTQPDRVRRIMDNCTPRYLVTTPDRLAAIQGSLTIDSHGPRPVIVGPDEVGRTSFAKVTEGHEFVPRPTLTDNDLAAIIYTSGSTGDPKGVTHLHRTIDAAVEVIIEYLGNDDSDVIMNVLPLSSSYGLLQLLCTVRTRARFVLEKGVGFPFEIIKRIREEGVTGFAGSPTIWAILLKLEGVKREDVRSLRYITNAAAALPVSFIPRLRQLFPTTRIYLMHGLTECLRTTFLPPEEVMTRSTSVGKGMRNIQLWLEDSERRVLGKGEAGELIVRGPSLMTGYWHDPESTAQVLIPGPFPWERVLRTGDVFRMDEEGYFHFVGRSDEVIKSKGEKVSPVEVENVIYTLDAVLENRVIGVPDDVLGQAIRAEIVLKDGKKLTDREVKSHCRLYLEDFKVPHVVEFVSTLPKTSTGKIRRTV
jgi:acyl-CoA synthetase (AMP-forming)/AMP-acid ligase II